MSRQCLYCSNELPKTTASNFCSKECWTEYKKLKAFNIDSDKQATVLLKKSDIAAADSLADESAESPADSQQPAASDSDTIQPKEFTDFEQKLSSLEQTFNDKFIELTDSINMKIQPLQESKQTSESTDISDINNRIIKLENDRERIEQLYRSTSKFEDRLITIEKKIREFKSASKVKKKGFFARLFS